MRVLKTLNLITARFQLAYALGSNEAQVGILFSPWHINQALVFDVLIDSPAERAGIKKGDQIIGINELKVNNFMDYVNYLKRSKINQGDTLKIRIERGGKELETEIKIPVIPFSPEEPEEQPIKEKPRKKELPV